jgi:hypothetical protein
MILMARFFLVSLLDTLNVETGLGDPQGTSRLEMPIPGITVDDGK